MATVIKIRIHEDLPTNAQNALRGAIEMGIWRREWREAEQSNDYYKMDYLNLNYEMVGMP